MRYVGTGQSQAADIKVANFWAGSQLTQHSRTPKRQHRGCVEHGSGRCVPINVNSKVSVVCGDWTLVCAHATAGMSPLLSSSVRVGLVLLVVRVVVRVDTLKLKPHSSNQTLQFKLSSVHEKASPPTKCTRIEHSVQHVIYNVQLYINASNLCTQVGFRTQNLHRESFSRPSCSRLFRVAPDKISTHASGTLMGVQLVLPSRFVHRPVGPLSHPAPTVR